MTLYRFLASKNPLEEVRSNAFQQVPLCEFKKIKDFPKSSFYFRLPHEKETVIYVEDNSKIGQLEIIKCHKVPQYVGSQIQRPYVYQMHGDMSEHCLTQLLTYIHEHVSEEDKVEIWSIWHGEKVNSNQIKRMRPQNITLTDLVMLKANENSCIKLFPKI
ncbi:hypothetical protein ACIQXF_01890 [Lysinibacillus sp. NPDC097231]|uniref:hypothetical protein n=1 Tax=Lysinibacillus sp. NPDC097231 TaxID=3364142 RepID=UPI0037F8F593